MLNLVTHQRNKKGQIENETPYRLVVDRGVRKFEVPAGSGEWFFESGEQIPQKEFPSVAKKLVKVNEKKEIELLRAELAKIKEQKTRNEEAMKDLKN